jgi:hypothetical protein
MNEQFRRWMNRNDESNGALMANTGITLVSLAVALLALVAAFQLMLNPLGNDSSSRTTDFAPITLVNGTPPTTLVFIKDDPGTDMTEIPDMTGKQFTQDNNLYGRDGSTYDQDHQSDPFGYDPQYIPQDPSQNGKSYDDPYNSREQQPNAKRHISIAVYDGCHTNSGDYTLVLSGLTPYGKYTTQTDWSGPGSFGEGENNVADANGRGIVKWSCFDTYAELPSGIYTVLVVDSATNNARTVELRVG